MKNSEAKIKKEIIILEILFVITVGLLFLSISLQRYWIGGSILIMSLLLLGNIRGRKNLSLNFILFKKFALDETTGQFEVAKPEMIFSKNRKHGVLLLHGFSASPQEFRYLIPLLKENEITFYVPRLTGFGIHDLTKLETIKAVQWLRDALNAFDLLSRDVDEVSIVGHSMGGLLAVLIAQQRKVKKLILSAPYLVENKNHSFKKKLLKMPTVLFLMSLFMPIVRKSTFDQNSDRFVYHAVPINSIKALWDLHSFLNLASTKNEFFLLAGKLDNTTNMQLNEEILNKNKISYSKYEFQKSGHNILEDVEHSEVAKKVIQILL